MLAPSWRILYPKVLELSLRSVGFFMSLCPYAYLELSLSGLLTAPDQGSLRTFGELFNISALDPLLPTLLIATLCLCALLTILYYSLVVAWEVFWASRWSPSPLDPSAEVVLTDPMGIICKNTANDLRKIWRRPSPNTNCWNRKSLHSFCNRERLWMPNLHCVHQTSRTTERLYDLVIFAD